MSHDPEPTFTLDDFTLPPLSIGSREWRWYKAEASSEGVKATLQVSPYRGSAPFTGGYFLQSYTARVNETAGTMGRKQEARAQELLKELTSRVEAALLAANWRKEIFHDRFHDQEVWIYGGPRLSEDEQMALEKSARRIWRGRYPWQGVEKVAPLAAFSMLPTLPPLYWIGADEELEVARDPEAGVLRVRHVRKRGTEEEQHRPEESKRVAVVGDTEARSRGAPPAFHSERKTRLVSFVCAWCRQVVQQQRYPSPKPAYCSPTCRREASREKTRVRVQQLRERRAHNQEELSKG